MDVCSHSVLSVSEDVSSFREFSVDSIKSTLIVMVDSSVDDPGKSLTEHLSVHDDQEFVLGPSTPSSSLGNAKRDKDPNSHHENTKTSEKCLSKAASFPSSARTTSTASSLKGKQEGQLKDEASDLTSEILKQNEDAKSVTPSYLRSISLPSPRKPVSAMKGSREKQGAPPMKLTVKWAPDVYDPTPTSVSHVVTNKPQRRNKKNSKNKQKATGGKNSKGSKSKDKKQGGRKHGGNCSNSSSRGYKMMDYDEEVVEFDELLTSVRDGDQYCGSSFLSKSVTSMHFSVAEAT